MSARPRTIYRVAKNRDNPYVMIRRDTLADESLSWAARGMLAYLLSKPDDWQVSVPQLVKAGPAGRDAVYRMIAELEAAGYLARSQTNADNGKFGPAVVTVHEVPCVGSPYTAFPDTVSPDTANPEQVNKEEQISNESTDTGPAGPAPAKPSKAGPGVDVFHAAYSRYPKGIHYEALNDAAARLGVEALRRGVVWWRDHDYRPGNVAGMIEVAEFGPGEFVNGKLVRPGQAAVTYV